MNLLAVDKGIAISCRSSHPVSVRGNRVRLKQLVVNPLDNAIKYTAGRGAIELRVDSVAGSAVLEVEDHGMGILDEALPYIFERFYRVDAARSGESEGAGLGLSIAKAICSARRADVQVRSVLGQGSCFRVTLPLAED